MKKGALYIGTSGWHYKHWKGTFYPADTADHDQFSLYAQEFDTVELNNPFYRVPPAKTFSQWRKASPEGFVFAVKANRFFTHMKKLKVDKPSLTDFMRKAGKLEEKLGPILFQLPPRWKVNPERFEDFLSSLPAGFRYCFEFRDHTWYTDKVYELLRAFNCAFCIYELEHHLSPILVTADFVYVRLHGPGNKYQGSYDDKSLQEWAKQCRQWLKKGNDVYVYFDNDQEGYSAFNAKTLKRLLSRYARP